MITGLNGKVKYYKDGIITCQVGQLEYEIMVPPNYSVFFTTMDNCNLEVYFNIYHYLQVTQSSATPILIGFLDEVHKQFFFELIKVNGIGPRTAVKIMSKPVEELAALIDSGDKDKLKKIPGISLQRASDIINKLSGHLKSYHGSDGYLVVNTSQLNDITKEALTALLNLQYKKQEAVDLINKAIAINPSITTTEALLAEIYKKRNPA